MLKQFNLLIIINTFFKITPQGGKESNEAIR